MCVRVSFFVAKSASKKRIARSHTVNIDPAASNAREAHEKLTAAACCLFINCGMQVLALRTYVSNKTP